MDHAISLIFISLSFFLSLVLVSPSPNKINNISFSIYFYFIVFTVIGSLTIAFSSENYDLPSYFILNNTRSQGLLIISICYFSYVSTIFSMQYIITKGRGRDIYSRYVMAISSHDSPIVINTIKACFVFSLSLLFYYLFFDDSIPLRQLILGVDAEAVYNARINIFNKGIIYFAVKKLSFCMAIVTALYFVSLRRNKIYSMLAVCNAVFYCLLQTEKGPLIFFLIAIFMVRVLCGHKFSAIKIMVSMFLSMLLLLGLFYLLYPSRDITSIFIGILSRIFVQQVSGVFLSFQTFGSYVDYDYGRNLFPKLFSFFSVGNDSAKLVAEYLAELYLPDLYASGSVKNINGMYAMDAWASLGMFGCVIVSIILAFYAVFTYHFFLRRKKTPLSISFYAYFSVFNFSFITNSGVAIFSPFAILFIIIFVFFDYQNNRFYNKLASWSSK